LESGRKPTVFKDHSGLKASIIKQ